MAEIDVAALLTPDVIGAAGGGAAALGRWALRLWATVRREGVLAATPQAAKREAFEAAVANAARADNARMVEALVEQARSNAALTGELAKSNAILGGNLDTVSGKIDLLAEAREWTPVEGHPVEPFTDERPLSERRRTAPRGYRQPARGEHDD
jgi:hypothetical protein